MSVNNELDIDLDGIPPERWYDWRQGLERCAVCLRNFEDIREDCRGDPVLEDDMDDYVPLQLFSLGPDGKPTERMLSLCWPCAEKRMRPAPTATGTE